MSLPAGSTTNAAQVPSPVQLPEEALCSHPGLTPVLLPSLRISAKVSPTLCVFLSQGSAFLSKYLSAVSEPSMAVSFTNLS